ncbi:MAG: exoribonuclease II [Buchnera aphidicola (Meitanaphis flavogallis)]
MFRNHPLLSRLKKKLHSKITRIEGIVKSTEKGFGFLETDPRTSYFIPPRKMKRVMHGDRIIAQLKIEHAREIVCPERLVEPFLSKFVGRIQKIKDTFYIKPDYPFLKEPIVCVISCPFLQSVRNGDWVMAVLTQHKLKGDYRFSAELIKFIVENKNPLVPWLVTLSRHKLDISEPKLNRTEVNFHDHHSRIDLTNLNFITIDHSSTKDIDDALFIEKEVLGMFSLIVAISDPTAYIPLGSVLDEIAFKRGFTNYLPGLNIPMLPRFLSEDKCSLKINQRRPAVACKIFFNYDGTILHEKTNFFLTWIKSKSQLSYESVSDWLEHKGTWRPESRLVANQLSLLHELCTLRIQWRKKNALLFKERPEYFFKISDTFKVLGIYVESKRIANKIIEEAMIAANVCAAQLLSDKLGFGVYNIHSGFESINAECAVSLLSKYDLLFDINQIQTLEGFCKLRRTLDDMSNEYLNNRIQKCLSFGEINSIPGPHFALGLPIYATWTSPIRKYGDIVNHRLLKIIITGIGEAIPPSNEILSKITDIRRRIRVAKRDIENWLYTSFLKKTNCENKVFNAKITDIFRSGMKVKLLENGANVFIPAPFLHNIKHELVCDKEKGIVYIMGKEYYTIANMIQVVLTDIKTETRRIIGKPI